MKHKTKCQTYVDFDGSSESSSSSYSSERSSQSSDDRHKRKRKRSHKKQSRRSRGHRHRHKHRKINTKAGLDTSYSSYQSFNDQLQGPAHNEIDRPVQTFSTAQLQSVNAPSAGAVRITSVSITPQKHPNSSRFDSNVNDIKDLGREQLEPEEEGLENR